MTTATGCEAQLLTVSRGRLLEVFAAFDGAASVAGLDPDDLDPNLRPEAIFEVLETLRVELMGPLSEAEYSEAMARSAEYEATMIEHAMESKVAGAQARKEIEIRDGRPAQLRLYAKRLRADDSADELRFPTSREVFDERSEDA
jgi:hypothetical protein